MKLSYTPKTGRPGTPSGAKEYGSYRVIPPKDLVERLGWKPGDILRPTLIDGQMVIAGPTSRQSQGGLDSIRCGDVIDEMSKIPAGSIELAITSPPYNVGAGYSDYSDDREYQDYRKWLTGVWIELKRVLVPGGRFALNIAPTSIANYRPVHMDLTQDIVKFGGLQPRAEILWYKQNMTAKRTAWGSFRRPSNPHVIPSWEYVLLFQNGQWRLDGDPSKADISSKDFVAWSNGMWKINPATQHHADHPAAFPEELIRRLILYYTYRENTILDMFGGTGTVAKVARDLGRHYIHIDKNRAYCDAAEARLQGRLTRGRRTKESERSTVRRLKRVQRPSKNALETFGPQVTV